MGILHITCDWKKRSKHPDKDVVIMNTVFHKYCYVIQKICRHYSCDVCGDLQLPDETPTKSLFDFDEEGV